MAVVASTSASGVVRARRAARAARLGGSRAARRLSAARATTPRGEGEGGGGGGGVEDAFARELRRRGLDPEGADAPEGADDTARRAAEELLARASGARAEPAAAPPPAAPRFAASAAPADDDDDQLARSRAINSEGLEGLIPRGLELLKLGVLSNAAFLPIIFSVGLLFYGTYYVFGTEFIHGGPTRGVPGYVAPEVLLAEETFDPYVPLPSAAERIVSPGTAYDFE